MSWFDDLAGGLSGAVTGGLGGFMAAGPVGALVGAAGGGIAGWSSADAKQAEIQRQRDYNATLMQREDTAVQRRAADMQAAGFNPMLAAGSPASSSAGVPVGSADNVGEGMKGGSNLFTIANLVQDSVLKGVQAGKLSSDTIGSNLDNELASKVLAFKVNMARTANESANIDWASKFDDPIEAWKTVVGSPMYTGLIKSKHDALISQLKSLGYDTQSKAAEASIADIMLKWTKEQDSLGAGYAKGVGAWTGAVPVPPYMKMLQGGK